MGLLSTKSAELLQSRLWLLGFYGHVAFGGLSLLVGWTQFVDRWRRTYVNWHRRTGLIYVASVLISGVCGLYIGFHATGGIVSQLGFLSLGIVWLWTTYRAYQAVRQKDFETHEIFMIYSFAACFAAVTLRLWLPLLSQLFGDFDQAYRLVAWLCWVPNLAVGHWIVLNKKVLK